MPTTEIGQLSESFDTVHYLDMSDKTRLCLTERVPPRADPRFERPTREHALRLARETFQRGERVDMQTLAAELGVVRSTLYRWVGDREQLLADVLATFSDATWDEALSGARGSGAERAFDAMERFMRLTAHYEPMRTFAQREPALALRVVMSRERTPAQHVSEQLTRIVLECTGAPLTDELRDAIELASAVASAFQWANVAAGLGAEIERGALAMRRLIEPALDQARTAA